MTLTNTSTFEWRPNYKATMKKYWLMKSEPDVFSIDHLMRDKNTLWEGVRNYQARNYMAKEMKVGDEILFYHSSTDPSGIAGIAIVSKAAAPDPSQFVKKSQYFDKKATLEKPVWFCVEVGFVKKFENIFPLSVLKTQEELKEMLVIKRGQRLSIQPVEAAHFNWIVTHLASKS